MSDPGYIAAGYLITAATVATYAWSIRSRTRRVARTLAFGAPTAATAPSADDEG